MSWEVISNLKTDVLHKAGEILHNLEGLAEDEIRDLERSGIIKNLEAQARQDESTIEAQSREDIATAEAQARQDEELARGQADSQVMNHVQQDVADAEQLAKQPGEPVNSGGQPTLEEIAATAAAV